MILSGNKRTALQCLRPIFPCILSYTTVAKNPPKLRSYPSESHNQLIKQLNNQGNFDRAFQLFEGLIKQKNINVPSLLSVLETCIQSNDRKRGSQIESLINQSDQWKNNIRLQTSLIKMSMKFQMVDHAEQIFERIHRLPQCDVVVYNAMLKGYLQNCKAEKCFEFVDKMRPKLSPDSVTYILLLNACSILRDEAQGKALHDEILSSSQMEHVHLQNALIDFYGRINQIDVAESIFNKMNLRETSTYNTLMKAFLINNAPLKVLELFELMKQSDIDSIGPLAFRPDLITFMAVCDACEKLGILNGPEGSFEQFNWKRIFSRHSTTFK